MATHSNILAGKIPWTEEPLRLQCIGSQKDTTEVTELCEVYCRKLSPGDNCLASHKLVSEESGRMNLGPITPCQAFC